MNVYSDKKEDTSIAVSNGRAIAAESKSAVQLKDNRPSSILQKKQVDELAAKKSNEAPAQKKANTTGLPDQLKSGVENLSGHSLDDVNVHYNSSQPAQLNAHAYAQGTDIHIASGQEKHLPHEAWHVVQQKQGRVKPTMQMKGKVSINDDEGLEKEADVMGAKAVQLQQKNSYQLKINPAPVDNGILVALQDKRPQALLQKRLAEGLANKNDASPLQKKANTIEHPVPSSGVVQLGKKPKVDKSKAFGSRKPKAEFKTREPFRETLREIKTSVNDARTHFESIKQRLEDDEDVKLLDDQKSEMNRLFALAVTTGTEIRGMPAKRLRNQSGDRDNLINLLTSYRVLINRLIKTTENMFPAHSGGFGAKGRAHDVPDVEINPAVLPVGKTDISTYLSSLKLDGKALDHKVFKSSAKVDKEKSGPAVIMGYAQSTYGDKPKAFEELKAKLAPVSKLQEATFSNTPVGKDRGLGQYANMANTNAAGYAALVNVANWQAQRWEWLHIRGAGLGGATDATNLVIGVRDANTHMIPFESNIRLLSSAVQSSAEYSELKVEWSVSDEVAPHAYRKIEIKWRLVKKLATAADHFGEVSFDPLDTGSNISKKEVETLENVLKEIRGKLLPKVA